MTYTYKNLDPGIAYFLEEGAKAGGPPLHTLSPAEVRLAIAGVEQMLMGEGEPVAHVEDRTIPGPAGDIPIRIYRPEGDGPFPVLVYYHGGGWVFDSIDTHDPVCRMWANSGACIVVSVGYRLAPEHKFPSALDDSYAALCWVAENAGQFQGDASRLAVGGDSAGGNIATIMAIMARDKNGPHLAFQLLIYPATDNSTFETESHQQFETGYLLETPLMEWCRNHYLNDLAEAKNPLASPLLTPDLSNLPPTFLCSGEADVLRDEGKAYADRLKEAGVPVQYKCYPGLIHAFIFMVKISEAARVALDEAAAALRTALAK